MQSQVLGADVNIMVGPWGSEHGSMLSFQHPYIALTFCEDNMIFYHLYVPLATSSDSPPKMQSCQLA